MSSTHVKDFNAKNIEIVSIKKNSNASYNLLNVALKNNGKPQNICVGMGELRSIKAFESNGEVSYSTLLIPKSHPTEVQTALDGMKQKIAEMLLARSKEWVPLIYKKAPKGQENPLDNLTVDSIMSCISLPQYISDDDEKNKGATPLKVKMQYGLVQDPNTKVYSTDKTVFRGLMKTPFMVDLKDCDMKITPENIEDEIRGGTLGLCVINVSLVTVKYDTKNNLLQINIPANLHHMKVFKLGEEYAGEKLQIEEYAEYITTGITETVEKVVDTVKDAVQSVKEKVMNVVSDSEQEDDDEI